MRKGISNRTYMAGKVVQMVHILLIKLRRRNAIFVMKLIIILQQLVQEKQIIQYFTCKKFVEMIQKGKVSRAQKQRILFSMFIPWSITEHRQTLMVNTREISAAITYHMTNIQPKSMFWYVMSIEKIQKMNSFF